MSSGSSRQRAFRSEKSAVEWLLGLVDYEKRPPVSPEPTRYFHLEHFRTFLEAMGAPHQVFPSVHVAGTAGKGWVCSALASICQAAGLKTGLYTSPHLRSFRERIRINGEMISERDFACGISTLGMSFKSAGEEGGFRTVFEILTALAFKTFAEASVDIAIVETGLGGRLDCTNVIMPKLSIITSIGWDHMAVLGGTIEAITREKAGIIKPGVPVVVGPQERKFRKAVMGEIRRVAKEKGARVLEAQKASSIRVVRESFAGASYKTEAAGKPMTLHWKKYGPAAETNLKTILASVNGLREQGFDISDAAVRKGLREWEWPGRLDLVCRRPKIIIDGAHNVNSAEALRKAISRVAKAKPVCWVIGMLRDKDIEGVLRVLVRGDDTLVATSAPPPRGAPASEIAEVAQRITGSVCVGETMQAAMGLARRISGINGIICVAGSLYTVAAAQDAASPNYGQKGIS